MRKIELQDIFKLAISIEDGAACLYQAAVDSKIHPVIVKMAKILIQQEQGHKVLFQKWSEEAQSRAQPDGEGIINPKVEDVLSRHYPDLKRAVDELLAVERTFTAEILRNSDPVRFIELGIHVEETSIHVYTKLLNFVAREDRPQIKKIVDEERRHLKNFLSLKNKVLDLKRL